MNYIKVALKSFYVQPILRNNQFFLHSRFELILIDFPSIPLFQFSSSMQDTDLKACYKISILYLD